MSDLVVNPEDQFFRDATHIVLWINDVSHPAGKELFILFLMCFVLYDVL